MTNYTDNLFNIKFVEDLILSFNGTAHLKDLSSGKYVLSNESNIKKVGLSNVNEIYGLTIHDLHTRMKNNWGNEMARKITELDNKVKADSEVIIEQNRFHLNADQYVFIHNMKKYPILNFKNQVSFVLTINENITHQVSFLKLWQLYTALYKDKSKIMAMEKYLQYIRIREYFFTLPTNTELIVFLKKQYNSTAKEIAKSLHISQRTVDTHINNLKYKTNVDLNFILEKMHIGDASRKPQNF